MSKDKIEVRVVIGSIKISPEKCRDCQGCSNPLKCKDIKKHSASAQLAEMPKGWVSIKRIEEIISTYSYPIISVEEMNNPKIESDKRAIFVSDLTKAFAEGDKNGK